MIVAVTGASGFLGRRVVKALTAAGVSVRAVVRSPSAAPAGVEVARAELGDRASLERAFVGADVVLGVAGLASTRVHAWAPNHAANVEGAHNSAAAAAAVGVRRYVHVSSIGVYALPPPWALWSRGPIGEDHPRFGAADRGRTGAYRVTKALGEAAVEAACGAAGLPLVIARPSALFGPGDPNFAPVLRRGLAWPVFPSPEACFPFVFVDDVAAALVAMCRPGGPVGTYTLAGAPYVPMSALVTTWARLTGARAHLVPTPIPLSLAFDSRRAARAFGFAETPLEEAVRRTLVEEGVELPAEGRVGREGRRESLGRSQIPQARPAAKPDFGASAPNPPLETGVPFQWRTWRRALLGTPDAARRAALLGAPLLAAGQSAALSLDRRFPFAEVEVRAPIFVVGPPRTGTTHLHRLLARDPQFASFRFWQILAPSITVQRAVRGAAALDARLGGRARRWIEAEQARLLGAADTMHTLRLDQPEEDEGLFLHTFGTELLATPLPVPPAFLEYRRFDQLSEERRDALMRYYRGCVQRHLYDAGVRRTFLSKNPVFCHKIHSLRRTFPDARFVVTVRHPAEAYRSLLSLLRFMREQVGVEEHDDDAVLDFVADCFRHSLDAADTLPAGAVHIVRQDVLARAPLATVEGIYRSFGLSMSEAVRGGLIAEDAAARTWQSGHKPTKDVDHARVEAALGFVYDRFGYPRVGR